MKTRARNSRPECRAAVAAACLIALAGCRGEHSPGDAAGNEKGHVGHVIPAHKPKTFPDAVRRLRELNAQISHNVAQEHHGLSPDELVLNVALDIANWLPEIAAESDMPEQPWNDVNARSATIVADYHAIRSGSAVSDANNCVNDASRAISDLESLLATADPLWFAGAEKGGGAPPSEAHGAEGE